MSSVENTKNQPTTGKRHYAGSITDLARSTTAKTSISDLSRARTWTSRSTVHVDPNKLKWVNSGIVSISIYIYIIYIYIYIYIFIKI